MSDGGKGLRVEREDVGERRNESREKEPGRDREREKETADTQKRERETSTRGKRFTIVWVVGIIDMTEMEI